MRLRHQQTALERAEKVCEEDGRSRFLKRSNWAMNLKVAIDNIRTHPKRVFDVESLLEVKGVGPKMAHVVSTILFTLYPPDVSGYAECSAGPTSRVTKKAGVTTNHGIRQVNKATEICSKKEYIPKLGTANYAFLIVLYREQYGKNPREYMTKEELMHAAEVSCLANKPIFSEGSASQAQPGSRYARSFYNGWSSFKSLVNNNLTYAWGNPKKISLTSKGTEVASRLYKDAVARGKIGPCPSLTREFSILIEEKNSKGTESAVDVVDSVIPSLRERLEKRIVPMKYPRGTMSTSSLPATQQSSEKIQSSSLVSRDYGARGNMPSPRPRECIPLPPLSRGKLFSEEYDIVLLIDERERYFDTGSSGHRLDAHVDRIRQQGVLVEIKTLPIGDTLWIARRKSNPREEYVLDYIIERKGLEDLISSVKESGRYHSQKYRLQQCGLRNMYYLVEGDIEALSSSSDYKLVCTVCAKTSVLDGFNVLRTRSVAETLRLYTRMTSSIVTLYDRVSRNGEATGKTCLALATFESQCRQFEKDSIKLQDIWTIMLNEVPRLGPQASISIAHAYPTPNSLRKALKRNREDTLLASIPLRKSTSRQATVGPCKSKSVIDTLF